MTYSPLSMAHLPRLVFSSKTPFLVTVLTLITHEAFMEHQLFSDADLARISEAVQRAEKKTSGEIVPYFVEKSDGYEESVWRGGAFLGSLAALIIAAVHLFSEGWHGLGLLEVIIIVAGAFGLGMALVHWFPALKRAFSGNELLERRVALRATQAFIAEEVFQTRDRTGILLFLSHLEHKVLVVGDSGINAKVDQSEWESVVARMVRGINRRKPADGLIEAIDQCGELLQRHGVKRRKRDSNELSNKMRIGSSRKGRKRS